MKKGYLSQYFTRIAAKKLSSVETDKFKSNQHEFNGTAALKNVLGTGTGEKIQFPTKFVWVGEENEAVSTDGMVTWYDARQKHPVRSEYRLYYPSTEVSSLAKSGDTIFIARRPDDSLMIIIAVGGTTVENQLIWLFNIAIQSEFDFSSQEVSGISDKEVDFVVRFILEELGIEPEETETDELDSILSPLNGKFPSSKEFSDLARKSRHVSNALEDPDGTLVTWMNHEENLFRRLERHDVSVRLRTGFTGVEEVDVNGFIGYSLSVLNRRKSRAGRALQNHVEEILKMHRVVYKAQAKTESKSEPDFLFPGEAQYHNHNFNPALLTMLAVKTSCKERWAQVLAEADRIPVKHLLTLEPGIPKNQTDKMEEKNLQLVLPASIHVTYSPEQQKKIMTVGSFLQLVLNKQKEITF